MGTDYFNVGWKLKALALTLILLLVLEGVFVVIVFWPGFSDETRVICFMATPLCFLIMMIISSHWRSSSGGPKAEPPTWIS
jgi:hypothetical protein